MAKNLFDQYGIKEVADVTIFKIEDNGDLTPYLYLDSLKVSTIEQTADQTEARGGKGNSPLIIWDFNKEINITLEDALYSPKSMALMFGGGKDWDQSTTVTVTKYLRWVPEVDTTTHATVLTDAEHTWNVVEVYGDNGQAIEDGTTFKKGANYIAKCTATAKTKASLTIEADDFPGTYKLVGDTYARNRDTGKDEYFQFTINRAKMSAEETLTLEAEGDPTTFNLNMRVLRPADGKMMELVQYTVD